MRLELNILVLEETNESEREIVCENGVCKVVNKDETKPVASTSTNNQESVELTTDEKVVRAKDLIEEKRKQKEMEEKEVSDFDIVKYIHIFVYNLYMCTFIF